MSGEWSLDSPTPIRPGFYISFQTVGAPGALGGRFGVVGLPIVADWGPINEFVTVRSLDELAAAFGPDAGTGNATTHLVREALVGGAAEVKVLRLADSDAAKSTKVLVDATPTTPKSITLTAKYEGDRGDTFKVTVVENALDATKNDLIIYEGNVKREIFTHTKTDADALVAAINHATRGSKLVTAARTAGTGAFAAGGLVSVTGQAFTGGDSGEDSLVAADYITALDLFEREGGFDVFALDGIDDEDIIENVVAWTKDMNAAGNYLMSVVGGPADEATAAAAIDRTEAYDSEFIVSVGGGNHMLTLEDGTEVERSSAQLTPRVAGMIAAAGITGSITRAVLPGVRVKTPLKRDEAESLIQGGVVSLFKRGDDTIIEDGLTSFTSFSDEKDATFATISNVRVMQQMGVDLNRIFETEFLGKIRNTETARQAVKTRIEGYLKLLEAQSVLINGSTVELDTRQNNYGHAIYYSVEVQFAPELKKILVGVRAPALV